MKVEYSIDEQDYLTGQLYVASTSVREKRRRKYFNIIYSLVYLAIAILFYYQGRMYGAAISVVISILLFFLLPVFVRGYHKRHYLRFVRETFKNNFGIHVFVEFHDEYLFTHDRGGEGKILLTEFEEVQDIPTVVMIKLKSGQYLIFPKRKIKNIDELVGYLKALTMKFNIDYVANDTWHW